MQQINLESIIADVTTMEGIAKLARLGFTFWKTDMYFCLSPVETETPKETDRYSSDWKTLYSKACGVALANEGALWNTLLHSESIAQVAAPAINVKSINLWLNHGEVDHRQFNDIHKRHEVYVKTANWFYNESNIDTRNSNTHNALTALGMLYVEHLNADGSKMTPNKTPPLDIPVFTIKALLDEIETTVAWAPSLSTMVQEVQDSIYEVNKIKLDCYLDLTRLRDDIIRLLVWASRYDLKDSKSIAKRFQETINRLEYRVFNRDGLYPKAVQEKAATRFLALHTCLTDVYKDFWSKVPTEEPKTAEPVECVDNSSTGSSVVLKDVIG